jgi:hypothetical protein
MIGGLRWLALAALFSCDAVLDIHPLPTLDDGGDDAHADVISSDAKADVIADAKADGDGGCAADLMTSAQNCGRCGHDCVGGSCDAGTCEAVTFAKDVSPDSVAVDSDNVYWSTYATGTVRACPRIGCDAGVTTFVISQEYLADIAADGTNVYWATFQNYDGGVGHVNTCPRTGCDGGVAAKLVSGAQPAGFLSGIAYDKGSGDLFFGVINNGIYKCATSGCNDSPTVVASLGPGFFAWVALDSTNAYWGDTANIWACNKSGCGTPTIPLNNNQIYVTDVATYGGNLYWTDRGNSETDGRIVTCSAVNCLSPTTLAQDRTQPIALAVDASGIYWLEHGTTAKAFADGVVAHCPLGGCGAGPTVLAPRDDDNTALHERIALDDVSVFWTQGWSNGSVQRVAKP